MNKRLRHWARNYLDACITGDSDMMKSLEKDINTRIPELEQENKELREIVLKMYENRFEPDKLCIYKHKALSQAKGEEDEL